MASKALVIYIYNPLFVMEHFQFSFFKKLILELYYLYCTFSSFLTTVMLWGGPGIENLLLPSSLSSSLSYYSGPTVGFCFDIVEARLIPNRKRGIYLVNSKIFVRTHEPTITIVGLL